jgi:hypothetical protein
VSCVTAPLVLWDGEGGAWHFLTITGDAAGAVRAHSVSSGPRRGFGAVRVEARIGGITWRTSVFPQKSGGYLLPVKADVRRRVGIAPGDEVTVNLELI